MNVLTILINLVIILGASLWIGKKLAANDKLIFWCSLTLKLAAGICLGLIYTYYYEAGDTFNFFDVASEHVGEFWRNPSAYADFMLHDSYEQWKGAARSLFFVKLISLVGIMSGNNYWVTSLWLSFISFLCCLFMYRAAVRTFPDAKLAAALAFMFFPSVLFWGSGVIKECVGLACLMILAGLYLRSMTSGQVRGWEFILAIAAAWLIWNLKYYWFAVLIPVTVSSLVVNKAGKQWSRYQLIAWFALFVGLCALGSLAHPNFHLHRLLMVVTENYNAFAAISNPDELITYPAPSDSWAGVLENVPWAIISGLFRPFLWEANSTLRLFAALENIFVLVMVISSLSRLPRLLSSTHRLITASAIAYVVVLCVFLALSTPNLGSLARYKVGFLPFLVFMTVYDNPILSRWRVR